MIFLNYLRKKNIFQLFYLWNFFWDHIQWQTVPIQGQNVKGILKKNKRREQNRAKNAAHTLANSIISLGKCNGFEDLAKEGMYKRYRIWNRKIARTDWRKIATIASYKAKNILKGAIFECQKCGLRIDRQLNAAINIYLKMGGLPHTLRWFNEKVNGQVHLDRGQAEGLQ